MTIGNTNDVTAKDVGLQIAAGNFTVLTAAIDKVNGESKATGPGYTISRVGAGHYRLAFDKRPFRIISAVCSALSDSLSVRVNTKAIDQTNGRVDFEYYIEDAAGVGVVSEIADNDGICFAVFCWYGSANVPKK